MRGQIAGWPGLQHAIEGQVVLPGSSGYHAARRTAVPQFDAAQPEAVVRCLTPNDVREALLFARLHDLAVAPRSGGHCFAARSSSEGMVIDVGGMAAVSLDGDIATIGAGAQLGDIYSSLARSGRTLVAGCGPDVGIAGLTLGGGLGILGRRYGLTCDQVLSATVVLADGSAVTCDAQRYPDLFWALRGAGGGQFGVVTSFVFGTVPAEPASAFHLAWSGTDVVRVAQLWQRWAPQARRELAASLLVTVDGGDGDELDAQPVAHIFGCMLGPGTETRSLLADFADHVGADPLMSDIQWLPYPDVKRYLNLLFGEPSVVRHHLYTSQFYDRPLSDHATEALIAGLTAGLTPGQARELDFTPWGGAYCDPGEDATAFAHRSQLFLLKQAVNLVPAPSPDEYRAAREWLHRTQSITGPPGTGRIYPNFPEPELLDWQKAYHGANFTRLTEVKARYDPGEFFGFPQSIPAA